MDDFNSNGYKIVKNAISKETAKLAEIEFELLKYHNPNSFNDGQVYNAWHWYGSFISESLLQLLMPKVEEVTGLNLYPAYSYGRIYYNGAEMAKHFDRPSCQYSATITISEDKQSDPWPIGFIDAKGLEKYFHLNVGDMCVYKGNELEHWRNKYNGQKQTQFFLHYVDQNGKYSDYKYDKREMLGFPPVRR